jgi:tetratricopeptide (TPR) repeat protein/DNA-binding CsgD family transcriptional regulator
VNEIVAELQRDLAAATDPAERIDLMIDIIGRTNHETPRDARKLASRALRIARSIGDGGRIGKSLTCIGICESELGNYASALEWFEKARPVCEESGAQDGLRATMHGMGIIHCNLGDYARAVECFEQTLEIARATGARGREANALNALGWVGLNLGDYSRALEYFLMADELLAGLDDPVVACDVSLNIGVVYAELGAAEKARGYYHRSLAIAEASNSRSLRISPLINLGNLLTKISENEGALDYYAQALELARDLGLRHGEMFALTNIGALHLDAGRHEPALGYLREALPIAQAIEDAAAWRIIFMIGRSHAERKEFPEALDWLTRALDGSRALEFLDNEVRVHETLSALYEDLGDAARSLDHYKQFAAIREKLFGQQQQRAVANLEMRAEIERAAREREILRLEKERLEADAEHRTKELTAMALHLVEKNQFLDALRREMSDVVGALDGSARPMVKGLLRQVDGNISADDDWRAFEEQFERVHHDFLKRLVARAPDLSRTELKICALLKINLSTKEIASMLATSDRTVGNHRYRIRKKLGLDEDVNITAYFAAL